MFACTSCKSEFSSIWSYNKHQKDHKNLNQLKIPCVFPNCNSVLTSYASFCKHVRRNHAHNSDGNFSCKFKNCNFTTKNSHNLKVHSKSHEKQEGDNFICGICSKTFPSLNALKIHISREEQTRYNPTEDSAQKKNVHAGMAHSLTEENSFDVGGAAKSNVLNLQVLS